MFAFMNDTNMDPKASTMADDKYTPMSLSGKDQNDAFRSDFRSHAKLMPLYDKVLDDRVIRPAEPGESFATASKKNLTSVLTHTTSDVARAAWEAEELALYTAGTGTGPRLVTVWTTRMWQDGLGLRNFQSLA
jgi:hypothetical protein